MKYDGFAFDTPDIRENEHGALQCSNRATPVTTSDAMVNAPGGHAEVAEIPTPDTSTALFLHNMAGGAE